MKKIVTLGEIMLRLSTCVGERLSQTNQLTMHYGGAEANVSVSLAHFGHDVYFVSKVPSNPLGAAAERHLKSHGVRTDYLLKGGERLGTYYLEAGVGERSAQVTYDRKYSSFSGLTMEELDVEEMFENAALFHVSGITLALSPDVRELTLLAMKKAKEYGMQTSLDFNYRASLWSQTEAAAAIKLLLPETLMQQAKSANIKIVAMVTTVSEAIQAEQAGCDAIVAQGSEAGGHRGTFDVSNHPMGAHIGVMALVPQIVDHVQIPVIAAGGIMDGRGLVAALALGAQGVQMGTRFLTSLESGAHESYKDALLKSTEESTVITKVFSGRPARGIVNKFIKHWDASGVEPLPFPTQNTITRDIRNAASKQNNTEYMSLWAGQGTRMLTDRQKAEDIVIQMLQEAQLLLS